MWSLRNKIAALFFVITLAAIAGMYLYVAPKLESSLRAEKLHTLSTAAAHYSRPLVRAIGTNVDEAQINGIVRRAADQASARVTLFGVARGSEGIQIYPISDSNAAARLSDLSFPTALDAARGGHTETGTESARSGRVAEAARPLYFGGRVARVVVYSAPLGDVLSNVGLIRRQIAIAGGIALVFALLAGYLVARALSRRVKRLEQAADQVASGDFSQSIAVDSDDELGQLARAFNQMQSQLAQLDSARKRFIATASHELRTPIFSLSGFVELLEDEELDEETRGQFLEQIRQQVDRLRKLSIELLDLSRLEAGSLELRDETVDLGALARDVSSEFTPALNQHRSTLELRTDALPVKASCDRERVAQIMRILIDNALAHTPEGTDVYVSAKRVNGRARLAVEDRGLGIKRPMLQRIFEPFVTTDEAQGAGLGLTIARDLAEQMNGELAVQSVPGRTTFTLELPS